MPQVTVGVAAPQPQYGMPTQVHPLAAVGPPPLPAGGKATPTIVVGGHDIAGISFNDYTMFAMDCLNQGKEVIITDIEVYASAAEDEILSMEVKYEVPKYHNNTFTEHFDKMHGNKPGSIMLPSANKHFFSKEYITSITGRHDGGKITKLIIMYTGGKAIEIGKDIGMLFNLNIPPGKKVVAFASEFTAHMNNIGVYYI